MKKLLDQFGVKELVLAEGAAEAAVHFLSDYKKPIVMSDCNTQGLFAALKQYPQHIFPTPPRPIKKTAEELAKQYKDNDIFVAVGSGTISDLVKYASHLAGKPYAMFPTAPSMNGYLSITASLMEDYKKESHTARLPIALFADLEVLANAPLRLIQSGVGDSICRPTAQADWLLSHLLLGTFYNPEPFEMVKPQEDYICTHAKKLLERDKEAIRQLMKWLLLGGLGMTMCKGSYPASQGEHMIAHTMEMLYGDQLPETFHGEQIGVTTLMMAELQERILAKKHLQLSPKALPEKDINLNKINEININLAKNWEKIRSDIKKIKKPAAEICNVLESINAPTSAEMLGWNAESLKQILPQIYTTRNRFTFLDIEGLTNF